MKFPPWRALLLYDAYEVFIEVSLFQKICSAPKNSWCASVTFRLTFHTTVWVFVNLTVYRKLIHDNISHAFWKPRIFCLVLFWMKYKIVSTYKYLHDIQETFVFSLSKSPQGSCWGYAKSSVFLRVSCFFCFCFLFFNLVSILFLLHFIEEGTFYVK